jgi:hypothetical protein
MRHAMQRVLHNMLETSLSSSVKISRGTIATEIQDTTHIIDEELQQKVQAVFLAINTIVD